MKKSLEDLPRDIAIDTWNDLLAWLRDYQKGSTVSKSDSIPFVEARFGALLEVAAHRAIERQEIADLSGDAHKISLSLAAKLKHLDGLQVRRESAPAGTDLAHLDAEIEIAKAGARTLESLMEAKEKEALAAEGADEIADMHGLRQKITASFPEGCRDDLEHPKQQGDMWQLAHHKTRRIRQPGVRLAVRSRGHSSPVSFLYRGPRYCDVARQTCSPC